MNPTSFASALKQGASEGVLVGYEFEIVIPKTFDKKAKHDTSKTLLLTSIGQLSGWLTDMLLEPSDISKLNKVIKIRADAEPAVSTFEEAYKICNDTGYTSFWDLVREIYPDKTKMSIAARAFRRNFENYFEITDAKKFLKWIEKTHAIELPHVEGDHSGKYIARTAALSEILKDEYNTEVEVFREYHQSTKSLDKWYIEPDGSLTADKGGTALEVVSPPIPAEKAADSLKTFFQIAKTYGFKTGKQYSTGLHINVSIPKTLDITKLILFLGDTHLLKTFDRVDNEYATGTATELDSETQYKDITKVKNRRGKNKVFKSKPNQKTVGFDSALLKKIASSMTEDHYASISDSGKYISFRHVGGDYLNDYQSILNVVGRFVQAIIIASDPNSHKQEYMKKLAKLSNKRLPTDTDKDRGNEVKYARSLLNTYQYLKTYGYPVIRVYGVNTDRWQAAYKGNSAYPQLAKYLEFYANSGRYVNLPDTRESAKQLAAYFASSGMSKNKISKLLSDNRRYSVTAMAFPDWNDLPIFIELSKKANPSVYVNYDEGHLLYKLDHIPMDDPTVRMHYVRPFMAEYKSVMSTIKYNGLDESEQAPIYYFAYGMLTDPDYLPGAELLGVGELRNFEFNLYAYANVEPKTGSKVHGALWKIDRNLLSALDQIEAYPELYDRRTYPVYLDGKKYPAEVYLMTPGTLKYVGGTVPRQSYINTMLKGYHNAGISAEQIYDAFYREDLTESLKQAYPYTTQEASEKIIYSFKTEAGQKYAIEYEEDGSAYEPVTFLSFYLVDTIGNPYRITGTGDQFKIFSTVVKSVEDYISKRHPSRLFFTTWKDEPSREKLYKQIVNTLGTKIPGYHADIKTSAYGKTQYNIRKNPDSEQNLNEALDQPYSYEMTTNNEKSGYYSYQFKTDKGLKYTVDFQGNIYTSLAFFLKQDTGFTTAMKTGTGDSYRVMATVVKIAEQFIKEHSPKVLSFSSSEYEPSRTKLYRTMINQLVRNSDYTVKEETLAGDIMFMLIKNK